MRQLMNLDASLLWKRGSGSRKREVETYLRGICPGSGLGALGAVLAALLLAVRHARRVQRAADDVVAHARQVAHAAAADEHDGVLLQRVLLARDVGRDLLAVAQLDARDLAQRRVGLLGRLDLDLQAHAALEGALLRHGRLAAAPVRAAALADELVDGRHSTSWDSETSRT